MQTARNVQRSEQWFTQYTQDPQHNAPETGTKIFLVPLFDMYGGKLGNLYI